MTGCQGELAQEEFDVYIEDEDGNAIVDTKLTTQANGFFDLWLPRNQSYRITIQQGNKVVESTLSTFDDDPTCVTTMRLSSSAP